MLDRLSLQVRAGETFALLGPNGAGKTTLLKCIVGLLAPVEGTITIGGRDRRRDHLEIRRFTAWLADQPYMYAHFHGRQWLEMVADLYAVPPQKRDLRIDELLEIFALDEQADQRIATYSNGQHKKLAICALFIADAKLMVMDEPFTGEIDPPGIAAFRRLLREMTRRGRTALFSTQMVAEAEHLADRIAILHEGRIEATGTADELKKRWEVDSLEEAIAVVARRSAAETTRRFLDSLDG